MGKASDQQLPVVQPHGRRRGRGEGGGGRDDGSGIFCCQRCGLDFRGFSFKCVFVVLLGFAALVYAFSSVLHLHSTHRYGFDAPDYIKHNAAVQAYFRLSKPVSEYSSRISELEYAIFDEIGLPSTKVAILSMHMDTTSNWTNVVFGVLSYPLNTSISPPYLSLLRSTFLDIFQQQVNLTLTDNTTFGQPSSFEILKFPGGMTLIPDQYRPVQEIYDILFKFNLNNSIAEIKTNSASLKTQLRDFLHLLSDETVSIQVSNRNGSTRDPPVTVEASVSSRGGAFLSLDRLRALAEIITNHPRENLGLDNHIFGKVKQVKLSSCLNHSLDPFPSLSPSPAPAPAPAPEISPSPFSQYYLPAPTQRQDSDDSALNDDQTQEISYIYKSYDDSTLWQPPSASASFLINDSSKDSWVTSSTVANHLYRFSVGRFSHFIYWKLILV